MKHRVPATDLKLRAFCILFVVGFVLVVARAFYLQVAIAPALQKRADQQRHGVVQLAPKRGAIYDRNGDALAVSHDAESLFADPRRIKDFTATANKLAPLLDLREKEILRLLQSPKHFVWLQRKLKPETVDEIKALHIAGLGFVPESKRYYPQSRTASHVLGFTGLDPKGLEGLELEYDGMLHGEPGRLVYQKDARGNSFATTTGQNPDREGKNLYLTLDRSLQYIAEKELARTVKESGAISGTLVMMEPATGAILAMASVPDYNPNYPGSFRASKRRNRTVTDTYEPGSTFKPFLLAGVLEEGLVNPNTIIYCENGRYAVGGKVIRDIKRSKELTIKEIVKYSSNIGFAKLGKAMERERFYRYIRDFGFGEKSGLDLPGESGGLVRPPSRWFEIDLAAISFGQGLSITPLQMTSAMSAIANGGVLMQPYIVERITDSDGTELRKNLPEVKRRVVSERTARMVRDMMIGVTEPGGTGTRAALPGYLVAGKTGTAQKVDPVTGGYSVDKWVSSFIGFVPADKPALVISVTVDEPEGKAYGGVVAAPVFARVASQALNHLNELPRGSIASLPTNEEAVEPLPDIAALLPASSDNEGIIMPDLRGMSYRQVMRVMQRRKINLQLSGSGKVIKQSPAPGKKVRYDKQARVVFGV